MKGSRAQRLKPQVQHRRATGWQTQTAVLPAACGLGRVRNAGQGVLAKVHTQESSQNSET